MAFGCDDLLSPKHVKFFLFAQAPVLYCFWQGALTARWFQRERGEFRNLWQKKTLSCCRAMISTSQSLRFSRTFKTFTHSEQGRQKEQILCECAPLAFIVIITSWHFEDGLRVYAIVNLFFFVVNLSLFF